MITDLIYRCPACGRFDWLVKGCCVGCGVAVRQISRSRLSVDGKTEPVADWYERVRAFGLGRPRDGVFLRSKPVVLSEEQPREVYRGLAGITATRFDRAKKDTGTLAVTPEGLVFSGRKGARQIPLGAITAVTIESSTVIVASRGQRPVFFDFLEESGKKWEDCIQKAVDIHHAPMRITEYCPRIRWAGQRPAVARSTSGHLPVRIPQRTWYQREPRLLVDLLRPVLKQAIKRGCKVQVAGLGHLPARGPAILVANHASFLDAVILSAFASRHIWFMTKNSQYRHPLMCRFLKLARTFPVRRYTVDVQAVRNAFRVLQAGHVLGIFPEGERNWDGRMMAFKQGTMRLILAAGQPVIPVGIAGAYELMPRWTSGIRRVPVTLRFGAPVRFDPVPIPAQTTVQVRSVTDTLRRRINVLMQQEN